MYRIFLQNNTTLNLEVQSAMSGAPHPALAWMARDGQVGSAERRQLGWLNPYFLPRGRPASLDIKVSTGADNIGLHQEILRLGWRFLSGISLDGGPMQYGEAPCQAGWQAGRHDIQVRCQAVYASRQGDLELVFHERPPRPSSCEDRLDLLAYNTWLRPTNMISDAQAQRAAEMPACLGGYDVVVLNEAFDIPLVKRLLGDLAGEYPHQTDVLGRRALPWPFGQKMKVWNGGVVILSKWPIEASSSRSFQGYLGPVDWWSDKGCLYARINKRGRRYHVIGTHSQASPENYVRWGYGLLNRDAVEELDHCRIANFEITRRFIDLLDIPKTEPVLIAGDLNTDRIKDRPAYHLMLDKLGARFPDSLKGHPYTYDSPTNPFVEEKGRGWLDYVLWARSHLAPESSEAAVRLIRSETGWRRHPLGEKYWDLSDHHAVAGRFTFPKI